MPSRGGESKKEKNKNVALEKEHRICNRGRSGVGRTKSAQSRKTNNSSRSPVATGCRRISWDLGGGGNSDRHSERRSCQSRPVYPAATPRDEPANSGPLSPRRSCRDCCLGQVVFRIWTRIQ